MSLLLSHSLCAQHTLLSLLSLIFFLFYLSLPLSLFLLLYSISLTTSLSPSLSSSPSQHRETSNASTLLYLFPPYLPTLILTHTHNTTHTHHTHTPHTHTPHISPLSTILSSLHNISSHVVYNVLKKIRIGHIILLLFNKFYIPKNWSGRREGKGMSEMFSPLKGSHWEASLLVRGEEMRDTGTVSARRRR